MPSFYTIFSLFMIFSDIAWEEIINDLEVLMLMVFKTTTVVGDSWLGGKAPRQQAVTSQHSLYWRYMAQAWGGYQSD